MVTIATPGMPRAWSRMALQSTDAKSAGVKGGQRLVPLGTAISQPEASRLSSEKPATATTML